MVSNGKKPVHRSNLIPAKTDKERYTSNWEARPAYRIHSFLESADEGLWLLLIFIHLYHIRSHVTLTVERSRRFNL